VSPKFTEHGKKRAADRGITPEEIDYLLASEKTLIRASKYDEFAMLSFGLINDRLWVVVSNWQTDNVITVRPVTKKEREVL
jgi:uncharacterized DUF497 family protein